MKILGLDSSGLVASVALVEDDQLVAEYTTNYKKTHSQTLLPMLDEITRMVELDLYTIGRDRGGCGPRIFYRASHRFGDCERTGTGTGSSYCAGTYGGGACLSALGQQGSGLSRHGCPERPGLHRHLPHDGPGAWRRFFPSAPLLWRNFWKRSMSLARV